MNRPLWVETLRFERAAQETAYVDYLKEVQHAAERVARLEAAIDPAAMILAAVAPRSRFARSKLLMGYSGMVSSEDSTGDTVRQGAITKAGSAHLRRIVGEPAWARQHRPAISAQMKVLGGTERGSQGDRVEDPAPPSHALPTPAE